MPGFPIWCKEGFMESGSRARPREDVAAQEAAVAALLRCFSRLERREDENVSVAVTLAGIGVPYQDGEKKTPRGET